jgi:arginine decarboxylase
MDQSRTPYADAVAMYADQHYLRLGTPGHQVSDLSHPKLSEYFGKHILSHDVQTLIEGIDVGPYPTALDESLSLAAAAWGAKRTWFLTNGASMGNLMACLALRALGDQIVLQRSVHSSVIDGLAFSGLAASFVLPSIDKHLGIANGITPEQLRESLANTSNAVAAYVVTPSYFGAVEDVAGLVQVAHDAGVPLVVDEAWGSHFGFHPDIPENAISLGADIVISSTHKLAGSLSQSAMLHLGNGEFAQTLEPLLDRVFQSLQSTSVNSLLLASLDIARMTMAAHGEEYIGHSLKSMQALRQEIEKSNRFVDIGSQLMAHEDVVELEPLRIAINTAVGGISGYSARAHLFDEYKIHCELATGSVLLMLCGAGVTPNIEAIASALDSLPQEQQSDSVTLDLPAPGKTHMTVRDAYVGLTEVVSARDAVGRVSAESVAAYPPGIPNLLPGEEISAEVVEFLQATINAPYGHVRGGAAPDMSLFRVVRD